MKKIIVPCICIMLVMTIIPLVACGEVTLKHLDIVSFSIFEDSEEPDFLHASIKLRDFKYSNLRTCYVVYFTFNCNRVDCEINEEENTMTWIVPKDVIGNPEAGDQFEDVHASTYLILQKNCEARFPLHLAKDIARPLIGAGYTYTVQY